MSALSHLLLLNLPPGKTRREVALAIAADPRFEVGEKTIYPYFNGKHGRPEEPTLLALSAHLRIPIQRLREAAGLPLGSAEPYVAPPAANRLNDRQRAALDHLILTIVEAMPAEAAPRLKAVARKSTPERKQRLAADE